MQLNQSLEESSLTVETLYPDVNSLSDIDKIEKINLKIASLELDGESKYIEFDYD